MDDDMRGNFIEARFEGVKAHTANAVPLGISGKKLILGTVTAKIRASDLGRYLKAISHKVLVEGSKNSRGIFSLCLRKSIGVIR
jgi:hypothetical protein